MLMSFNSICFIKKNKFFFRSFSDSVLRSSSKYETVFNSVFYYELKYKIKDLPLNDKSQLEIEEYLLDIEYLGLKDKKDTNSYFNIINKEFKDVLIKGSDELKLLILNFKKLKLDVKLKDKQKLTQDEKTQFRLSVILTLVDVEYLN